MEQMPSGIFDTRYQQTLSIIRTPLQWGFFVGFLIFLFTLPLYISNYLSSVLNMMGIILIACLGVQVALGYCGQITLGQAAFMALGAYSWVILVTRLHFSILLAIPAAGFISAIVGIFFALPSVRLKGFYLAVATLAAHFIIIYVILHGGKLTGGASEGLISPPVEIANINFFSDKNQYFLIMLCVVIMIYLITNLMRSKIGRAFVAIRDNDLAAEVMGINVFLYKTLAFAICSFCAGISGCFWAIAQGIIHPDQFHLMDSIWLLAIVIIGGMGSIMGTIFGTVFMQTLKEIILIITPIAAERLSFIDVSRSSGIIYLIFGMILALFLIYEPRGLNQTWLIIKRKYRLWPFQH